VLISESRRTYCSEQHGVVTCRDFVSTCRNDWVCTACHSLLSSVAHCGFGSFTVPHLVPCSDVSHECIVCWTVGSRWTLSFQTLFARSPQPTCILTYSVASRHPSCIYYEKWCHSGRVTGGPKVRRACAEPEATVEFHESTSEAFVVCAATLDDLCGWEAVPRPSVWLVGFDMSHHMLPPRKKPVTDTAIFPGWHLRTFVYAMCAHDA
jgi:hypothetical protein